MSAPESQRAVYPADIQSTEELKPAAPPEDAIRNGVFHRDITKSFRAAHPAGKPVGVLDPPGAGNIEEAVRSKVEKVLGCYLTEVEALRILSGVLIGSPRPGERRGYVWNIFGEDFSLREKPDPRFRELNRLIVQLEEDLSGLVPLRISHVNPSQLDEHRRRCAVQNIETELLSF